jgi:peptidoglycan/LPS O-acetylase OafA/YrhL
LSHPCYCDGCFYRGHYKHDLPELEGIIHLKRGIQNPLGQWYTFAQVACCIASGRREAAMTLGERITATGGRSSGFDYLRIVLAVAVVLWHSFTTTYGDAFAYAFLTTEWRPVVAVIVPMFFALSGWLIAGSLFRNSIVTFIGLRAIRIMPALTMETMLSGLILGPSLTTLPLKAYFTNPVFFKYLENVVGHIHTRLPGVFIGNPVDNVVNGQLWTVPWELWCYLAIIVAGMLNVVRMRTLFLAITIVATIALFAFEVVARGQINQENGVAPQALLMAFLSAVALFLYRDRMPWSGVIAAAAAIATVGLLRIPGGDYLTGFPVAYVTIYLGLLNPKRVLILRGADYSYGLYIYHYAIQQAIVYLLPAYRQWYFVFASSFMVSAVFAAFSWIYVEKPALNWRRYLPKIELIVASVLPGRKVTPRADASPIP